MRYGFCIKLSNELGLTTCHTTKEKMVSAASAILSLNMIFLRLRFMDELVFKIIQFAPWIAKVTTEIKPIIIVNQSMIPGWSDKGLKLLFHKGKKK